MIRKMDTEWDIPPAKRVQLWGLNWSFAPIVDINYDFHNPITNVRTFGSDPKKVLDFALEYMKGADECGVAVAIKHFPGDGVDERDQHILTSVNSFSAEKELTLVRIC